MSQATSPLSRALALGRRLTGTAELPVTGAVVLALLALVQVTSEATGSGPVEVDLGGDLAVVDDGPATFALLLGLLATAPLAFVRTRLVPVAVLVTSANAVTLAGGHVPTVAATISLVVVVYLVARQRAQRYWLLLLVPWAVLLAFPSERPVDTRRPSPSCSR